MMGDFFEYVYAALGVAFIIAVVAFAAYAIKQVMDDRDRD